MRLLGLDVGSKTVGVAQSDPLGWTARSVEIIRIDENKGEFGLDRLGEIISEKKITGVVVGLPKNMNNTEGPRVDASRNYGKMVEDHFGLPVDYEMSGYKR
ncbi:Holliday junction resolvase [Oenococcus alcoholitolerans]|uniref:Holliday junction resolvase n=1 Tax=Oenococcus alcoholitolerans TaxID=931074 RepID=A0ABR4XRV1_9LACO|nr:Holliday junction resolvase [Oenococcus alcoholitolerans]